MKKTAMSSLVLSAGLSDQAGIDFLRSLEWLKPTLANSKKPRDKPKNPYTVDSPEVKQMTKDFYNRKEALESKKYKGKYYCQCDNHASCGNWFQLVKPGTTCSLCGVGGMQPKM